MLAPCSAEVPQLWCPHTNVHASPQRVPPAWHCPASYLRCGPGQDARRGPFVTWVTVGQEAPRLASEAPGDPQKTRGRNQGISQGLAARFPYGHLSTCSLSLPSPIIRITGLVLELAFLLMETLQFHIHYKGNSQLRMRRFAYKVWGPLVPPKGEGVVGSQTSVIGLDWPCTHFVPF